MEWNGGVDYWSGVLDWTTGVTRTQIYYFDSKIAEGHTGATWSSHLGH